ncbi:hypothetical protein BH10PSE10_BH10PSE10_12530 [soil metagenome]
MVVARPRRPTPVLICKKCLKRSDDGGEIRHSLKSELKQRAKASGGKRPRAVMTSCFGICPKRAVVVASEATLKRGEYVLLTNSEGVAGAVDILKPEAAKEARPAERRLADRDR